jgi:hypothetical protein
MLSSSQMITLNTKEDFIIQPDDNINVIIQPNDNIEQKETVITQQPNCRSNVNIQLDDKNKRKGEYHPHPARFYNIHVTI